MYVCILKLYENLADSDFHIFQNNMRVQQNAYYVDCILFLEMQRDDNFAALFAYSLLMCTFAFSSKYLKYMKNL